MVTSYMVAYTDFVGISFDEFASDPPLNRTPFFTSPIPMKWGCDGGTGFTFEAIHERI